VIGQRLVHVVPRIPLHREVVTDLFQQLALRANPGEEHDEVQAKKDLGIDRGTATNCVAICDKVSDEGEIKHTMQMSEEVILWHGGLDGHEHGTIQVPRLRWSEHAALLFDLAALPARPQILVERLA
jgi:hypothetical protein